MRARRDGRGAGAGLEGPRASIVVDARALHVSGIGRYLREILTALFADSRFGRISLLGVPAELREYCETRVDPARVEVYDYSYPFYTPLLNLGWARLRARGGARGDVAFFPHFDAPVVGLPVRSVVTVQDLTHLKVPEAYPAVKRFFAGAVIDRVVSSAGRVLVTSDRTRLDLLERRPGIAPRMEVIPLGVDVRQWALRGDEARGATPDAPYLLCVGNRKPHKNLVSAVEALARVRASWPELRLVIVGRPFPEGDGVRERAAALGVSAAVEERSSVDDAELRALYRRAHALVFPSIYEGFGLPVLEAMASGTPVVASDRASVPEVVGDAGLVAPATDAAAIAEAVLRLRDEPELRATLVARGRERARLYSWSSTAERTLDVLASVASVPVSAPAEPVLAGEVGAGR